MHILIVGCGQLSRMLALTGVRMGMRFSFVAEHDEDTVCVEGLGRVFQRDRGQTIAALLGDSQLPDVISFEKEQFDIGMLAGIDKRCAIYPNEAAIYACQDRFRERRLLTSLSIPIAPYQHNGKIVDSLSDLSLPLVVKSCGAGYDGKNQWKIKTTEEAKAFDANPCDGDHTHGDYIVEQWLPFDKEVSMIAVRSSQGEMRYYPLTENRHENGILKSSISHTHYSDTELEREARAFITQIMRSLDYVGVLAMECFVVDGELIVNELAPRVHNSGHWTQMGSVCCQFENHLRAITGMALGSTDNKISGVAGMVNLIGRQKPALTTLSDNATMHWYNKSVRPGRKLGHINIIGDNSAAVREAMRKAI